MAHAVEKDMFLLSFPEVGESSEVWRVLTQKFFVDKIRLEALTVCDTYAYYLAFKFAVLN